MADDPKIPKWAQPRRSHPANMMVDTDGRPVPIPPEAVDHAIADIINTGKLVLAVFEVEGALAVQSFEPPSEKIVRTLEAALRGYRESLKGVTGTQQ